MDSWTLQGDSYSFLRSAPRTFSLCHRDGTPNHVEIFDIINTPTQRSAISETTCLCDIFGDDCESPAHSSSPAVAAFVPLPRDEDGTSAASPLVDDQNDSGSYHTAPGSSEGEEGFEDSAEGHLSPPVETEERQSEPNGLSSAQPELFDNGSSNSEAKGKSPKPPLSAASPSLEVPSAAHSERTPSPGHSSPHCLSSEGRVSSLSSSSTETRRSSLSSGQLQSEAEARRITPTFKDRLSSPSHQSLTQSPSPQPRNCGSAASSESLNIQSEFTEGFSPEPRSSSSAPGTSSKICSLGFMSSAPESRGSLSSPFSSSSCTEFSSQSRETSISPELRDTSCAPEIQASSPFSELRGRVSLPDLFSRGSTPDLEDSPQTNNLISDSEKEARNSASTPQSRAAAIPSETGSALSTPAPRYTPPSPVISFTPSPEPRVSIVSPEFTQTSPSPDLLSASSLAKSQSRTPSPGPPPKINSPSPETSTHVASYSLSPSPEVARNSTPIEHRHAAPSPEIRITPSSPENDWTEQSLKVETSDSPFLGPSFEVPSRSPSSSPHITGISYSVIQPEDRDSPPFPELCRLSSPESERTRASPEARSPTPGRDSKQSSRAASAGTPRHSPHVSGFASPVLPLEITHQSRYKTPSPQPKYPSPLPEARYPTPASEKSHSPSPQDRSSDPSPQQRYNQKSPSTLFLECNPQYSQPTLPPHNTLEIRASPSSPINTKIEQPTPLETNISPSIELNKEDKSAVSEIKGESPIATVQTPVSTSPLISEKTHRSLSKQNTEREVTPKELGLQHISDLAALSEEKQESDPIFAQSVDPSYLPHTENKSPSSNLNIFGEEKVQRISPVQKITPSKPLQKPRFKNYSPTSGGSGTAKASSTPQLATKVGREKITKGTEGMAHHINRRRTPSPPLTRFTPVHIIAPEKPYRQWQNRSPPQVVASSQAGNVKKVVTNRESPDVVPVDNNSQPHWVRLGKQLEMERKMQLEEEGEIGRERQRDREMERGKMREGRELEKGEEWQGDASYRGEQVELSFNARNRKGPASRGTAPTGRDTRQGLPTAHSYSESLLATRQLQQQQSLLRLPSQQDAKGGGPSRRLHPPAPQNKSSTRVVANRPCQSSSSSMGSEFDEADNEVKWFTDVAFSSLSSPEVDYLDMYNSSHRSSTNISQPSTQESPAGISASWPAYADFRGSAQKLDNDDPSFQQPSAYYSDGLDPAKCYEMGSFECIDVAVEREDTRKVRRGVPKRQIQLKRKDSTEGKQDESSDNSSPGVPMMALNSPSLESPSREALLRQHSTPATMQECYPSEHSPEPCQQTQRNSRLQKSVSLDESSPKTKMATCLIKSVLSKKMQSVDKQADEEAADEVSPPFEENNAGPPLKESSKPVTDNPKSSHGSDYSPQFEGLAMRREERDEARPSRGFGVKPSRRPSSSSSNRSVNFSQTDIKDTDSPDRNEPSQKSEFKVPCERKQQSRAAEERGDDSNTWEENQGGDSANATARNAAAPPATGASSGSQARMTKKGQECENTEDYKQPQPCDKSPRMSKTQEITLKGVEKKKASLNVCLTPETENKPFVPAPDTSFREKEEGDDASVDLKTEEEDRNGNNKTNKVPIHKVRDVRRLVKNTYNLSFKATSSAPLDVAEERTEIFNEERKEEIKEERREERREEVVEREIRSEARKEEIVVERREEQKVEMKDEKILSPPLQSKAKPPSHLQIQCKAVCWKDDKNKTSTQKDTEDPSEKVSVKHITNISREEENTSTRDLQTNTRKDAAPPKPCQPDLKVEAESKETTYKVPESESKPVMVRTDRKPPMLGSLPRMPSKEREVSTAVVLIRDGSNKTKTSASPAHEEAPPPPQAPAAPPSPELTTSGSTTGPGGHSVSMLLKEKGYHADIGSVVGEAQNGAGGKGVARKHVNCLEIPLQTNVPSDGRVESHRERTFSSSSTVSGPSAVSDSADTKTSREEENKDTAKQKAAALQATAQDQTPTKQKEHGDFEAVKRQDPTFPPRSPAIRRFRPQPIEVKSLSKEAQKQDTAPNSTGSNRPQTIEVKSIAKNAQKPAVPPKPTCKFKPADFAAAPIEAQRPTVTTSSVKPHGEERSQTIVVSSPTIYRKISNESNSSSNYTRKLAVSTVSSLKPPQSKITATTISSLSNQSASVDTEAHNDRGQQQQPGASPQISRAMQRPTTLATAPGSTSGGAGVPSAVAVPDPGANHASEPPSAGDRQASQPAVLEPNSQVQYPREAYPHDQGMPITSNNPKQPAAVSTTQAPGYTQQQYRRSMSNERTHRTDDMRFYVSDDPPSYDERESFSPLMLPDLTPRRSNRYQPSSRPPPCSCTAGCPPHPGLPPPPHHHRSPHNLTPPAPAHSPGQVLPYAQPPLRPHQCRSDPQPMSFQPSLSPKSSPLGQSQPPAMYQPLHQPPPHPSLMQGCPGDRPMQPIDPRRAPAHRSPQQPPSISGAPYSDPGHSHSPGLPPMDPQYLCGPQSLGQSYGSEYGGDSSSLYSEGGYGQTPRRVLMDPETGKYFYIEVPMQPLRKMLFDPETGQYVEVLIPQQAMSHSGLYPPSAAPYPPLHNPNMYAPAPQYMPYAAPPPPPPAAPPAHPQTQPPRYPEASAAATMHPNGPGVSYRNSTGQGSKPEPQNHPPLDQSYLEGMYYVPTGMNASPNPTPPVYYHKHPPNLPPTGGKRS